MVQHLVKGLREIKHSNIGLGMSIQDGGKVMGGDQQLPFTGAFSAETMLAVYKDVMKDEVPHSLRHYDMFCDFTADSRQQDRPVVFGFGSCSLLEDRSH